MDAKHKSQFKFFLQRSMIISLEKAKLPNMENMENDFKKQTKVKILASLTGILTLLAIWSSVVLLYLAQRNQDFQVS